MERIISRNDTHYKRMTSISAALLVILCMMLSGAEITALVSALSAFAMATVKLLPSAKRISYNLETIAFQKPALDKAHWFIKSASRL